MTLINGAALQRGLERESRLFDEPIGPEEPSTREDYRVYFEAADLEEGDTIELEDGVEATVDGVVPCPGSEFPDVEVAVHYSGYDPNPEVGEFRNWMPGFFFGEDLARGRIDVQEG